MNLVVGGAGFIGSHVVDTLQEHGEDIIILDPAQPPIPLSDTAEHVAASAADTSLYPDLLTGVDTVFLLSGRTGIGTSLEQPQQYYEDNLWAVLPLLNAINESGVETVVAASTILVHGEGPYSCTDCGIVFPGRREQSQLEQGAWEQHCSCGNVLTPIPIQEDHPVQPRTPYSRSKLAFEHVIRDMLDEHIDRTILRYPFVYGPRQNGAAHYFFTSLLDRERSTVFEDGQQQRDFMYVGDVGTATVKAATAPSDTYNIGTGTPTSVHEFVIRIGAVTGNSTDPRLPGTFRAYDVRHAIPDTARFTDDLGIDCASLETGLQKTLEYYRQ